MEIIFCSVCNESIPAGDLVEKRAVQHGGRAICARCEAAMSAGTTPGLPTGAALSMEDTALSAEIGGTPGVDTQVVEPVRVHRIHAGRGGSAVGIAAALAGLALLVAGGMGAFLFERSNRIGADLARAEEAQAALRQETARMQQTLATSISDIEKSLTLATEVLASLKAEVGGLATRQTSASEALGNDLAGIAARLDEVEGVRTAVGGQREELARLESRFDAIRKELEGLSGRVAAGEEAAKAPAPEQPPAPEAAAPAWRAFVADLDNANSGVRWQAVQSLGAARDPAVIELLLPMLADSDIFVRMATARVLGDLGSTAAVSALIDALDDPEASVREAADVALRAITGQDFEFDAGGKEAERAKRVKAWRDWWRRFSEETGASREPTRDARVEHAVRLARA
jgi:hypothetical protein